MSDRTNAGNLVGGLVVGGVVAIGLGALIASVEWPHESVYNDDSGSAVLAYLGLLIIGLGQLALFAAVVAWAVTVGIRWSGLHEAIERSARPAGGLSGVEPLGPVGDRTYLDEDGR
ncbi:hypothetical protein ASC77_17125 [Nocardioides sp. Root1257]|uniref:hypothetical protein n=1 Tax=unclassified Nocardioides TaxID=2615069 RepID=UPI0006F8C4BE|nr:MULTISPECIES: hypothetical protein [unclassified Nocardioides]KQW46920.1 hypothetical protein ASC77_17125 [Nocardioides sp. Root1257]KRC43667.1 hypothetical protein ASE24_18080 [Nocardioides sp. Root224]